MKKEVLGNLLVGLTTILLLLGLGELMARWYFSKTDDTTKELTIYQPSEILGWEHQPNSKAIQKWGGREITYTINSLGLRDLGLGKPALTLEKSRDKKRVALLGDSFTFGMLMNDDETYATKLQKMLGEKFEVLNFGVIGHAVDQYYLQLREKVVEFQPDIVVVSYFVGNDATELRAHEWATDDLGTMQKIHDTWHIVSEDHQLRRKKTSLFPRSYFLTFFRERGRILLAKLGLPVKWPNLFFSNFLPKDHPQGDPNIDLYYEKVKQMLSEMKKLADAHAIKLLVMLIPADIQVDLKYLSKYPRAPFEKKEFEEALPQKKLLEFTSKLNIQTFDLLPSLREISQRNGNDRGDLYFAKKDPHFTSEGHQKTAELLFSKLKMLGWLW